MYDRRPRLRSFDYLGIYRYFLTFCVHERAPVFTVAETVALVLSQILDAARQHRFAVIAYVFMPDHVHLLVEGRDDSADLKAFASLAKQKSAYAYSQVEKKRLWPPSYYDRVLRSEDATASVIRYILENPIRRGLVVDWKEYPFVGSEEYRLEELAEAVRDQTVWQP